MNFVFVVLVCVSSSLRFQESEVQGNHSLVEVSRELDTEGVRNVQHEEILSEDVEDDAGRRRRRRRRRRRKSDSAPAPAPAADSPAPGSNAERLDNVMDVEFTAKLDFSGEPKLDGKVVTIAEWCASTKATDVLAKAFAPSVRTILTQYDLKVVTDAVIEEKLKKTIKCKSLPEAVSLLEASVAATTDHAGVHRVVITFPEDDWERKPSTAENSHTVTASVLDFIWKLSTTVDTVSASFIAAVGNGGVAETAARLVGLTEVKELIQMTKATAGLTGFLSIQVRHGDDEVVSTFMQTAGGTLVTAAVKRDLATTFSVPESSLSVVLTKTVVDFTAKQTWRILMGFTEAGAVHLGVNDKDKAVKFWADYLTCDVCKKKFSSAFATALGIETSMMKVTAMVFGHALYNAAAEDKARCIGVDFQYFSQNEADRDLVITKMESLALTNEVSRKAMLAMTTEGIGMSIPPLPGQAVTNVALEFRKMVVGGKAGEVGAKLTTLSTVDSEDHAQYKKEDLDANRAHADAWDAMAKDTDDNNKAFGKAACVGLGNKCGSFLVAYTISLKISALENVPALVKAGKTLSRNYGSTGLSTKFKAAVALTGGYTVNEVHSYGLRTASTLV